MDPRVRPLQGTLWQWGRNKVAFESGAADSARKLIVLGGLGDGLLPCRWAPALSDAAAATGWATVQPTLSSAYTGYGTGMLQRDVDELSELVAHMVAERGCERIAIVGHSTGCQIACAFARDGAADARARLAAVALQAPVSDQESGMLNEATERWLAHARALPCASRALMPAEAHWSPITAERFLSLFSADGAQPDDLFSSYLTDAQLEARLGHLRGLPILVAYSMADEYVPPTVDKDALVGRLTRALGERAVPLKLAGASHSLDGPADGSAADEFVRATVELLRSVRDD
jgi:alpha-beta hydrolase superfamily lysophospholipase